MGWKNWFTGGPARAYRSSPRRPTLEALEDRTVPAFLLSQVPGQGVWRYSDTTGQLTQLTAATADRVLVNHSGDVAGDFTGSGVWRYRDSVGWQQLSAA